MFSQYNEGINQKLLNKYSSLDDTTLPIPNDGFETILTGFPPVVCWGLKKQVARAHDYKTWFTA